MTIAGESDLTAVVDRLRLDQALTNLISNALKYGRGRPVELSIEAVGTRRVRIKVQDQGIGIKPESLPLIFDQFERGVSERHYPGFGLGLWITQQVVTAMNGTVSVQSVPDQGSTFTLEVPRSAPPAKEGPPGES